MFILKHNLLLFSMIFKIFSSHYSTFFILTTNVSFCTFLGVQYLHSYNHLYIALYNLLLICLQLYYKILIFFQICQGRLAPKQINFQYFLYHFLHLKLLILLICHHILAQLQNLLVLLPFLRLYLCNYSLYLFDIIFFAKLLLLIKEKTSQICLDFALRIFDQFYYIIYKILALAVRHIVTVYTVKI